MEQNPLNYSDASKKINFLNQLVNKIESQPVDWKGFRVSNINRTASETLDIQSIAQSALSEKENLNYEITANLTSLIPYFENLPDEKNIKLAYELFKKELANHNKAISTFINSKNDEIVIAQSDLEIANDALESAAFEVEKYRKQYVKFYKQFEQVIDIVDVFHNITTSLPNSHLLLDRYKLINKELISTSDALFLANTAISEFNTAYDTANNLIHKKQNEILVENFFMEEFKDTPSMKDSFNLLRDRALADLPETSNSQQVKRACLNALSWRANYIAQLMREEHESNHAFNNLDYIGSIFGEGICLGITLETIMGETNLTEARFIQGSYVANLELPIFLIERAVLQLFLKLKGSSSEQDLAAANQMIEDILKPVAEKLGYTDITQFVIDIEQPGMQGILSKGAIASPQILFKHMYNQYLKILLDLGPTAPLPLYLPKIVEAISTIDHSKLSLAIIKRLQKKGWTSQGLIIDDKIINLRQELKKLELQSPEQCKFHLEISKGSGKSHAIYLSLNPPEFLDANDIDSSLKLRGKRMANNATDLIDQLQIYLTTLYPEHKKFKLFAYIKQPSQ